MKEEHDNLSGDSGADDDILSMGDDELEELGEGLELGDAQAEEIRNIFLTTLPQYLEPVADMVEQLLATTEADCSEALTATLLSLSTAAARIGVQEVKVCLDQMHSLVTHVDDRESPFPAAVHSQLVLVLEQIREISSGGTLSEDPDGPSQTIISALKELGDVDDSLLAKLSAAGVVTVEQLKMAQVHEIVAVSGLETDAVKKLLSSLGVEERLSGREALAAQRQAKDNAKGNIVDLQLPGVALRSHYESKLRTQVELESAIDEIRAEVQRKRNNNSALRTQWEVATQHKAELEAALADAQEDIHQRLIVLGRLPKLQEQLAQEDRDACQKNEEMEKRILQLRSEREGLRAEEDQFAQELGKLGQRVARMLDLIAEK